MNILKSALLSIVFASVALAAPPSFTVKLQVDLSGAKGYEPLYEIGPAKLVIRQAGADKNLENYDHADKAGNYVNFPLPDGSCPVIEATICSTGGRVGIPLGALKKSDGVHDVTLNFSPVHWTIAVDERRDDDMPREENSVKWPENAKEKILSPRVKSAKFTSPALPGGLPQMPDARRISGSIQYWTPPDHNAWVGDVAVCLWKNRFHVFYLYYRRHHGSGGGAGRHYFAHISSADLVNWDEHPHAVPIDKWWETLGTGTPFAYQGKLHLAYGLHTSRLTKDKAYPIGATYAVSDDGIHFKKSDKLFHWTQNPTVYNRKDGLLGLVLGYGAGGIWKSDHLGDWKLVDDKVPARGDCPCPFEWNGRHYLLQGFNKFAYSPNGEPGTYVNWASKAPYDGLGVPMVAPFGDNRRILAGWLGGAGWGGWLAFRELVQFPDDTLGTKWVPEIKPPTEPFSFTVQPGKPFCVSFAAQTGTGLLMKIDPEKRTATFIDDLPDAKPAGGLTSGGNVQIRNLPEFKEPYQVRVVKYWDKKSNRTIFDLEIGAVRTLITQRVGKFSDPTVR